MEELRLCLIVFGLQKVRRAADLGLSVQGGADWGCTGAGLKADPRGCVVLRVCASFRVSGARLAGFPCPV